MTIKVKQILFIVLILAVILSLLFVIYCRYFVKLNPENLVIDKVRIVIIEDDERVNYQTIENHSIKDAIVDQEMFNKLKQYMKEKNLRIKPGRYELHDADSFKRLIRRLKFEPDTQKKNIKIVK